MRIGRRKIDLIERRDVLNLLDSVSQYMGNWLLQYIEDGISSIPSAQPEQIRTQMSLANCISRRDAIDAVNAYLGLSSVSRTIQNMTSIQEILEKLPSAQPELIEKVAYIRGFEQGRTQGMIDAQGGKK